MEPHRTRPRGIAQNPAARWSSEPSRAGSGYRGLNHRDPFGLWPCPPLCGSPSQYIRGVGEGVWNNLAAKTGAAIGFLKDLTPVGDAERSAAAFAEGRYMAGAANAGMALVGAVPGG